MKSNTIKLIAINFLVLVTSVIAEPDIVKFTVVGGLLDQWGGSMSFVNSDGSIYGGSNYFGGGFTWTEEGGVNNIGGHYIRGMDNNGLVVGETLFPMIMGDTLTDVEAACYYDGEEWVMIGPIAGTQPFDPYHYQGAWSIAADTMIIAGMYWHNNFKTTAFVWTPNDPDGELLPDNGLELSSRPNDMNADGSVIVGWASVDADGQYTDRAAHAWFYNESTGQYDLEFLGSLGGHEPWVGGEAYGVSPNGELICGWSPSAMFIWSEQTGIQDIGYAPSHNPAEAGVIPMDITNDGVVVGFAQPRTWIWTREAIIYTPESGIVFLKDSLESLGLEDMFEDYGFFQANDISDDGLIIVGNGAGIDGIMSPFILEFLPPSAPTDLASDIYNDADGTWIDLVWEEYPGNNEYNYHLQRRVTIQDSTSEWTTLAYPDSNHVSYRDTEIYLSNGVEWEYRLRAENPVGESEWIEIMTYSSTDLITAGLPSEFRINHAYPNPFNPTTTIEYAIPHRMDTKIILYSVTGAELAVLSQGMVEAGVHSLHLDMSAYSSGVYLINIISGDQTAVQKLTLIK